MKLSKREMVARINFYYETFGRDQSAPREITIKTANLFFCLLGLQRRYGKILDLSKVKRPWENKNAKTI